jgi:tetratricopeptide (TPR) repeat protein
MRHFTFLSLTFSLLCSTQSYAQQAAPDPAAPPSEPVISSSSSDPKVRVSELFSELKRERQSTKADSIAKEIVSLWEDFDSATINTLFQRAMNATNEKNYAAALDYFDQIIVIEPDYAQAYYRRSFVHFSNGATNKSVADLYSTLELEPKHFGAMFELTRILELTGHDKAALSALERFLAIYPTDTFARERQAELAEKIAGTRS